MDCGFGLISIKTTEKKFELKSLETLVNISNLLVTCSSDFTYFNLADEAEEAVFTFPMQGTCTVHKFEAVVNGKTIKGMCKEKEQAKNMYESAKEKGLEAAICTRYLDQHDMFNLKVGNVQPKSEVKIHIEFVLELTKSLLKPDDLKFERFNIDFPVILKPRYSPEENYMIRPTYTIDNPFEFKFEARINGSFVVKQVKCPSSNLKTDYTNDNCTNAVVKLDPNYDCKKDLEIYIDYLIDKSAPSIYYEKSFKDDADMNCGAFLKTDAAILNFQISNLPFIKKESVEKNRKFDIVFVIDRSGSMSGELIQKAKECLLIFLKSLPRNCKFQIYGFGSRFDKVFDSSRLYDKKAMKLAMRYQSHLKSDFGGTEILAPLHDLYNIDVASDYERLVFVLTDGCVSNQNEVCELIRKNQVSTRVFTVGIGDGVSTSLINEMAEAGVGRSVFVRDKTNLSEKVIELLNSALNARVTSCFVKLECPDHVNVMMIPDKFNNVLDTQFLTAACVITGMQDDDVLSGSIIGEIKSENVDIDCKFQLKRPDNQDESYGAHYHLAKLQIDRMTAQYYDNGKKDEALKKTLVELSEKSSIISDFTAFVAVEENEDKSENIVNELLFHEIAKDKMDENWNFKPFGCLNSSPNFQCRLTKCGLGSSGSFSYRSDSKVLSKKKSKGVGLSFPQKLFCFKSKSKPIKEVIKEDIVLTIIKQQEIMGNWSYDEDLIKTMGIDAKKMLQNKPNDIEKDVWMTMIIYCYLNVKQINDKGKWIMVSDKSKSWIDEQLNDDTQFAELEKIIINNL